jgi:hypothetical protein
MSSFGRKAQRKNRPKSADASTQLTKAIAALGQIQALGNLGEIAPLVEETHRLVVLASEDVQNVSRELAHHRAVLEILSRGNSEAIELLTFNDVDDDLPPVPQLEIVDVRHRDRT